jgi:hypothetical protein
LFNVMQNLKSEKEGCAWNNNFLRFWILCSTYSQTCLKGYLRQVYL